MAQSPTDSVARESFRVPILSLWSVVERATLAAVPTTPAAVLVDLADSPETEVLRELVGNPRCPPEALRRLRDTGMMSWRHGNAPADLVSWAVRHGQYTPEAAAQHPNLDSEGMLWLAQGAIKRRSMPDDGSSYDSAYWTEFHLASRLDLSEQTMRLLASSGNYCRSILAAHRFAPPDVLDVLVRDSDPMISQAAIKNPNLPRYLRAMVQLAQDPGSG
jgi:hypothetical protein